MMRVAAAWLVHLFTASGVVLAFLALEATERGEWRLALLWLLAALAVDGVDGSLARWARVKEHAPRIDGEAFDLIVDYLNYVFVPAVFIGRAGLVPEALALPLAAAILLSSVYVFVRRDMKTPDNYFRGFPALWNVVALYLFVAQPGAVAGAVVVTLLAFLSFASIRFVHPFRITDYQPLPRIAAIALGDRDPRPALAGMEPRPGAGLAVDLLRFGGRPARSEPDPDLARGAQGGRRGPVRLTAF